MDPINLAPTFAQVGIRFNEEVGPSQPIEVRVR